MSTIAQQEGSDDIVRDSSHAAADQQNQKTSPDMPGQREPQCSRNPHQCGTNHRNQREKSYQHGPEYSCADACESEGKTAEGTLNGRDQQANRNAGENQVSRLAHHVVLNVRVKRQKMAHYPADLFSIAEHEEKRKEQHKKIEEEREKVFDQGAYFWRQKSCDSFRTALYGTGKIRV